MARRTGRPEARARSRGPWRRAGVGRRTAVRACGRGRARVREPTTACATPRLDLGLREAGKPQAERQVLAHRHVRVERVGLEHHGDAALARRHVVDELAVDQKLAVRDRFQSRDHAQRRRLAAAGRADEDDELAVGDVEIDAADGRLTAVDLDEVAQADGSHRSERASPHRSRFHDRVGVARFGQSREPVRTAGSRS